jgi:hypothetical protein
LIGVPRQSPRFESAATTHRTQSFRETDYAYLEILREALWSAINLAPFF